MLKHEILMGFSLSCNCMPRLEYLLKLFVFKKDYFSKKRAVMSTCNFCLSEPLSICALI